MSQARRLVTTRAGGRSAPPYASFNLSDRVGDEPAAVAANRIRLATAVGVAPESLVFLRQVHGSTVHTIDRPPLDGPPPGDGLVTASPGLALVVLAADCVPVLLADPVAGVIGVAHAGRLGAAAGVVPATVRAMAALGAEPARIDALLGPAICGACYEVPAAMRAEVVAALPGAATVARRGTPGLDLRAGLARQLSSAGVAAVVTDPACTAEDDRFYSYRRDGVTGRFAGVAWLR